VFSQGANEVSVIAAASPSDWRDHRHLRARARRALRELSTSTLI
jgi:hypothetical protein